MLFDMPWTDALILAPILLLSLVFHELAHAAVSYKLGDTTPKTEGRLTLNPLKHLDPIGTVLLLLAGFGWAKPVRIDIRQYRKPYAGLVLTSVAGPLTNLVLALLALFLIRLGYTTDSLSFVLRPGWQRVLSMTGVVNITLFAFNMLPIPPLDGSRIVTALLKDHQRFVTAYNRVGLYLLVALMLMDRITMGKVALIRPFLNWVTNLIARIVFAGL